MSLGRCSVPGCGREIHSWFVLNERPSGPREKQFIECPSCRVKRVHRERKERGVIYRPRGAAVKRT